MKKHIKAAAAALIALLTVAGIITGLFLTVGTSGRPTLDVIYVQAEKALWPAIAPLLQTAEPSMQSSYVSPDGSLTLTIDDTLYFRLEADAAPFYAAGFQDADIGTLDVFTYLGSFESERIGFHAAMGHFNIALNAREVSVGTAMVEWAQDPAANDKDVVFVLDPEPLIAAGVDPEKVEGWAYADVPVMQGNKTVQAKKFLKAFNPV
ncbi:MAG: hypothetical protein LBR73_08225 [Oscillospiraceae bacterium]|jgi:hypothetical protein|nr:hypothetical protein [Oscillospiraceae bacterium]